MKTHADSDPLAWLLEGDASVRWQAMRDLAGSSNAAVQRERKLVASTGWGAQLLNRQDAGGRWSGGLYTPKWTSTTYTVQLLRTLGLPLNPQARRGCRILLDEGYSMDRGINFFAPRYQRSETCVTAMVLSAASWFRVQDRRVDNLAAYLMDCQMADGGWNCRATPGYGGATHGSFHTTILALEALWDYQQFRPERASPAAEAQAYGREFLLAHRLFRSHRTGAIVKPEFLRFSFPPRWHYDVLRSLDYFAACVVDRDPRLEEGIALVRRKRQPDGRWVLENPHRGKTFFEMENPGEPSRWNTLRALRVLRWWESV